MATDPFKAYWEARAEAEDAIHDVFIDYVEELLDKPAGSLDAVEVEAWSGESEDAFHLVGTDLTDEQDDRFFEETLSDDRLYFARDFAQHNSGRHGTFTFVRKAVRDRKLQAILDPILDAQEGTR